MGPFARYHPVAWTKSLAIDDSPVAVVLERILRVAQQAVPHLVCEALLRADDGPLLLPPDATASNSGSY